MAVVQTLKQASKALLFHSRAVDYARFRVRGKIPVLMYHRLCDGQDPYFPGVTPDTFRRQMYYLKEHYHLITMDDLTVLWAERGVLPQKSVVVTFDDGHKSFREMAYPILTELKVPAIVYIATDAIDGAGFFQPDILSWSLKLTSASALEIRENGSALKFSLRTTEEKIQALRGISAVLKRVQNHRRNEIMQNLSGQLRVDFSQLPADWMMTWSAVKEIHRGGIMIGAHTLSHPILSRISAEQAEHEITESKKRLEAALQAPVRHFAYPNGGAEDYSDIHKTQIAKAGFDTASSTIYGFNDAGTDRYDLRRIYACEESLANFACRLAGIGS